MATAPPAHFLFFFWGGGGGGGGLLSPGLCFRLLAINCVWPLHFGPCLLINPLPTDDTIWHCQILAACYQLVQFVLKISSALAERVGQGEVGGCTALADSAWR